MPLFLGQMRFPPTLPWGLAQLSPAMQLAEALYRYNWDGQSKVYATMTWVHDEVSITINKR